MRKVISLYTGAGGLDLGLEAAGFTTTVAVEYNAAACRTLRANSGSARPWEVIEGDIHDVSSEEICRLGSVRPGEAALLVGGPPCQPFSKAAYWVHGDTKRLDDKRADTLSAYLRVLKDLQPQAFLLENVFGLTYKGKDEALRLLKRTVEKINSECGTAYSFEWRVLNCANYGVPQVRERFFLVGVRNGAKFVFPEATHQEPGCPKRLKPWKTAWDAIGDLDGLKQEGLAPTGKWGDLLPTIPEGKNYLHHTERGEGEPLFGWRRRYWSFLLKLAKDRPSWTIQAQPGAGIGPFHWKSRRLSPKELMRIQTFPKGYKIEGGYTEVQRQLGNAVPSLMTEILGRELMQQVFGEDCSGSPLKLIPPARRHTPKAERTRRVPEKYHQFIGDHSAHPGTGKGHLVSGR